MTMRDSGALLHNMSAPPKSVVKYSGLADLATVRSPGGSGVTGIGFKGDGFFGVPVRFALPADLAGKSPADILRHLGADAQPDQPAVGIVGAAAHGPRRGQRERIDRRLHLHA